MCQRVLQKTVHSVKWVAAHMIGQQCFAKLRQYFGKTSGVNSENELNAIYRYLVHMKETANGKAVNNATEYRVDRKGRSQYNEFNTLAMQWANSADRQNGDVIILHHDRTSVLLQASDGHYIELASGKYEEVKSEYDGFVSEQTNRPDEIAEIIRTGQGHDLRDSFNDEIGRGYSDNSRSVGSDELQNDTAGNTENLRSGYKGKSETAADLNESAFSMSENEKQFSISNDKSKQNNGITAVIWCANLGCGAWNCATVRVIGRYRAPLMCANGC